MGRRSIREQRQQRKKQKRKEAKQLLRNQNAVGVESPESPLTQHGQSESLEAPEDKYKLLHSFDPFHDTRKRLRSLAIHGNEYGGIPTPIEGETLIVEPKHRLFQFFSNQNKPDTDDDGDVLVNRFYSSKKQSDVLIWKDKEGKTQWGIEPCINHFPMDLKTMACSVAWSVESEATALQMLASLIPHHAFKYYLLTGMFLESSKRSGVSYCFRKLRPTVAIRPDHKTGYMRILCCLCAHPIGYYSGTWAGSMTPTDDVISHLLMMRADEHFFWRRCNQHPSYRPEAGL